MNSAQLAERARHLMPGGVSSPVRSFRKVGGIPRFIEHASGSRVMDADGVEYVDYVMGWGALLFGHASPFVRAAIEHALARGIGCGVPHDTEVDFAERLLSLLQWPEQVRFANSGTEAAMTAIRLARAATGRAGLLQFTGGYHGHADVTLGSFSDGVPPGVIQDVHATGYGDLDGVRRVLAKHAHTMAAVIVEPVAANMGVVRPDPDFLRGLRALCDQFGVLLVFDEVVTGFRVAAGGAVETSGIIPDLAVYGKVLGGGLPVGAVAGSTALLSRLAPVGPVIHGGTFAGHPLTVAAGQATLEQISGDPELYQELESMGSGLEAALRDVASAFGEPFRITRVGSMWSPRFTSPDEFSRFFHALLARRVHLAPSPLEANFISTAHSQADIDHTVAAVREALTEIYASRR